MQPNDQPTSINPTPQPTPLDEQVTQTHLTEDPGKTFGIVGLILTIIGLGIAGAILGIIGLIKSKKAGFTNVTAIITIILNAVGLLIVIPLIVIFLTTTQSTILQGATGMNSQPDDTYALETVNQVNDLYERIGRYPTSLSDFKSQAGNELDSRIIFADHELSSAPSQSSTIAFYICHHEAQTGIKVVYWDTVKNRTDYVYTADYSESELGKNEEPTCTLSAD